MLAHEAARCDRLATWWETRELHHPLMQGPLNMAQITLACGLGFARRVPGLQWREGHAQLAAWFDRLSGHPSLVATLPPGPG